MQELERVLDGGDVLEALVDKRLAVTNQKHDSVPSSLVVPRRSQPSFGGV